MFRDKRPAPPPEVLTRPALDAVPPYFTVLIPWAPPEFRTEWHPSDSAGPFAVLTRGSFKTFADAVAWASDKLRGAPYGVKSYIDHDYDDEGAAVYRCVCPACAAFDPSRTPVKCRRATCTERTHDPSGYCAGHRAVSS